MALALPPINLRTRTEQNCYSVVRIACAAQRRASGAAGSGSAADAVRRRLHAFVRRGMCDGRRATLRLPPLCCAFPAAGEIDGHVSPDPLGGSQRPHLGEMLGLELLALGGGQL